MKISVLMACYNPKEQYLVKSINSIINQDYEDFEVIIVDDGSQIDVQEILEKNKIFFSNIKIIKLLENKGLPKALNIGLKNCNGEYIARMDDDDIMMPNRLSKQKLYIECNGLDGCWSNFDRINQNGDFVESVICKIKEDNLLKQLVSKGNILCHSTLFIKKDILTELGGYDENLRYAQDSELYIRILEKYKMGIVKERLVQFRINNYRNNYYKECFSDVCAFFGAYLFYVRNNKSLKYKVWFIKRVILFVIRVTIIYPCSIRKSSIINSQ